MVDELTTKRKEALSDAIKNSSSNSREIKNLKYRFSRHTIIIFLEERNIMLYTQHNNTYTSACRIITTTQ